ncbi:NAD(P)/FAD-dependent oxidoreductase [Brevibacillus centrosporus]|uniref:NAD(P)/FAD-dependent oxidoreductase n=1 Tax=Brevibacillus centrosporus TaxID=54910 RepID=UPI002E1E8865|nr:FAD-dependent oxidoreductase [Brevibacillus centrosporus]MED1953564.1 FAD-dependent oxidoreductase [Brevibacillus centrosporus]
MIDALIIGAGPAGLSAAIACAKQDLSVVVIDEFYRAGGRLLGQLHQEPDGTWWNGVEEALRLDLEARTLGVDIRCGVSVYDVARTTDGWNVSTTAGEMETPLLLIATGASETAVPVPGWTLPGVMSIGAAQVMTNVQRVRVGERGVVIGVNILSVAIARELQLAGIQIDRMTLPPASSITGNAGLPEEVMRALLRVAHLAPSPLLRWGSRFMHSHWMQSLAVRLYPSRGFSMWDIPIQLRTAALEIVGKAQVEGVRIAQITPDGHPIFGTEQLIPADFVCIAGGLSPLAELAAIAGCPFAYVPSLGGHVPIHNDQMQTALPGLFVAGNITGVESAKVAMAQGKVAGLSMAYARGALTDPSPLTDAIRDVKAVRQRATIQFHPEIIEGRALVEKLALAPVAP